MDTLWKAKTSPCHYVTDNQELCELWSAGKGRHTTDTDFFLWEEAKFN